MRWARWIVLLLIAGFIGAFLHYTLPQRDVVRITGTDILRQDLSGWNRIFFARSDSGNEAAGNRDLRLINTVLFEGVDAQSGEIEEGSVYVYRNEDTGIFGWPPYFKVGSSDLHAEATDLASTREEPVWAVITHYGWRFQALSIYPNAVSIRELDDPNVSLFPWFNIVLLLLIALLLFGIWRLWERFQERVIAPVVDRVLVSWDKLRDRFR